MLYHVDGAYVESGELTVLLCIVDAGNHSIRAYYMPKMSVLGILPAGTLHDTLIDQFMLTSDTFTKHLPNHCVVSPQLPRPRQEPITTLVSSTMIYQSEG